MGSKEKAYCIDFMAERTEQRKKERGENIRRTTARFIPTIPFRTGTAWKSPQRLEHEQTLSLMTVIAGFHRMLAGYRSANER